MSGTDVQHTADGARSASQNLSAAHRLRAALAAHDNSDESLARIGMAADRLLHEQQIRKLWAECEAPFKPSVWYRRRALEAETAAERTRLLDEAGRHLGITEPCGKCDVCVAAAITSEWVAPPVSRAIELGRQVLAARAARGGSRA